MKDLSLEEIAKFYLHPMPDQKTADEWIKAYRSLDAGEYERFNELVYSLVREDDEAGKEVDEARLSLSREFRGEINNVSMKRHGKPQNQIDPQEAGNISAELWDHSFKSESAAVSPAASCICPVYPLLTIPAGKTFYSHNSQGRQRAANHPECNDCDLEVWFPFGNDRIQWISGAGWAYYSTLGGRFALRKVQPHNRILIGYDAVTYVFGTEYFAQIAYRMIP